MRPLTRPEQLVFGVDAKVHPITDLPLQDGHGAASADQQAVEHLDVLRHERDRAVALLVDIDHEIGDHETDPRKLPLLEKRRASVTAARDQASTRLRKVTSQLLLSGAVERARGKAFAESMRIELKGT